MSRSIFIAAALALAATLSAAPAQAASRTFVSAAGNDSNPCTITLPCRLLQAAYNAVAANGQIDALDPGNYGSLTITGPVSIEGHGWASMSAPSGAAITINANTGDKISIIGVVLDGLGITNTIGVRFNSGGTLNVRDSVIRNFGIYGIFFAPNSSTQILVSNTLISDNGDNGIYIAPTGSGTTSGVLNHVEMENNGNDGLAVQTASQTVSLTVIDSVSANNGFDGILANPIGGTVSIMVRSSTVVDNNAAGVETFGANGVLRVTRSTITGNNAGWANALGGTVVSYGDNNIDGNVGVNTEPPGPLTYQ